MNNDQQESGVAGNTDRQKILHSTGVVVASLPSAIVIFLFIAFGAPKEDCFTLYGTYLVCLAASVVLVSVGKYYFAYVVAFAPVPILVLMAILMSLPSTYRWSEEVMLDDGTVIEVKRKVKLSANGLEQLDSKLSFTGNLEKLPPWQASVMPMVLYVDAVTKEWVVVGVSNSCEVWRRNGKPVPPYWEFHLESGTWKQVPLSSISVGRRANLVHDYNKRLTSGHSTVDEKRKLDAPYRPLESMDRNERMDWIVSNDFDHFSC